jgi:hypothetical protein
VLSVWLRRDVVELGTIEPRPKPPAVTGVINGSGRPGAELLVGSPGRGAAS